MPLPLALILIHVHDYWLSPTIADDRDISFRSIKDARVQMSSIQGVYIPHCSWISNHLVQLQHFRWWALSLAQLEFGVNEFHQLPYLYFILLWWEMVRKHFFYSYRYVEDDVNNECKLFHIIPHNVRQLTSYYQKSLIPQFLWQPERVSQFKALINLTCHHILSSTHQILKWLKLLDKVNLADIYKYGLSWDLNSDSGMEWNGEMERWNEIVELWNKGMTTQSTLQWQLLPITCSLANNYQGRFQSKSEGQLKVIRSGSPFLD